jgi:uncharacterized membrane protein YccC
VIAARWVDRFAGSDPGLGRFRLALQSAASVGAIFAALLSFVGTSNSGEQVRKACFRVAWTVTGVVVGALLAAAVGHTHWCIVVILAAVFLYFYLERINYAFGAIGITVIVSQVYVQLDEFSDSVLLLRLAETALGAGVAIVVAALVLPLRTRRGLRIAARDLVRAVARLAGHASGHGPADAPGPFRRLRRAHLAGIATGRGRPGLQPQPGHRHRTDWGG